MYWMLRVKRLYVKIAPSESIEWNSNSKATRREEKEEKEEKEDYCLYDERNKCPSPHCYFYNFIYIVTSTISQIHQNLESSDNIYKVVHL